VESLDNLKKFYSNKRIFITGHTGFKGTWLSIILNYLNAKVYGYSLAPEKNSLFKKSGIKKKLCSNSYADIRNIKDLKKKINLYKPEIIFHLAAQPLVIDSFKKPIETFNTNILGTANLLECLRNIKAVKSVIIVTTDKVYKINKKDKMYKEVDQLGGTDPYSVSKVGAEIVTDCYIKSFFKNSNLKNRISVVRAGNVIGGGDFSKNRLVPDIIRAINNKKKLNIRNRNHIRPWQHVLDPLVGYIILAKKQYVKKINNNFEFAWNFGPSKSNFKKVFEVVKEAQKLENFSCSFKKKEKFPETAILKLESAKAKKKINWSSKWNLSVALKKTIEWNRSIKKNVSVENKCVQQFLTYINDK
jgi:CDP-glucose 4,6-dehydratase